jgi:hypothetical protein
MKTLAVMLAPFAVVLAFQEGDKPAELKKAFIDGEGPEWVALTGADFVAVNGAEDTWNWRPDGSVHCTGQPIGVTRSKETFTNFELVCEWSHVKPAGNSGVFLWAPPDALEGLKPGQLPKGGIEVQVLDHGYKEHYEKSSGKKATWFTTDGDVFPVGTSKMKPFPPISPDGSRSFPRKNLAKGHGDWNHYYIRAVNGEVRLWVNGEEVSGGTNCEPKTGYLCLESEGSPVVFRNIRIRKLP